MFERKTVPNAGKILVITLSNIGDVILSTPVISCLRKNFPEAEITVSVGPKGREVVEGSSAVDRVITYERHMSFKEKWEYFRFLRRMKFDIVVDLKGSLIPFLLKPKLGWRLIFGSSGSVVNMRNKHLAALKELRISTDDTGNFDFYDEDNLKRAKNMLTGNDCLREGNIVCVAPGARSDTKRWPAVGFSDLINRLSRSGDFRFVIIGDANETRVAHEVEYYAECKVLNLAGKTSLKELGAILSMSGLLITNDSAPMHLAAELNIPVVALFGPTNHFKYGRDRDNFKVVRTGIECSPCEMAQCKFGHRRCLTKLSPTKAYKVSKELLFENEKACVG